MKTQLLVLGTKGAIKGDRKGVRVFFLFPGKKLSKDAEGLTPLSGFLETDNAKKVFTELPACYHADFEPCKDDNYLEPDIELSNMSFALHVNLEVLTEEEAVA